MGENLGPNSFDLDGFLICLKHGQRRYGWRTVPYRGKTASYSALEYEQYILFGKIPPSLRADLRTKTPDRRDNRDPEEIGSAILRQTD